MITFVVIRRSDGAEVYRYNADAPVEWTGMEFSDFDHVAQEPDAPPPAPEDPNGWLLDVGAFYDRFGTEKYPILASQDPLIQAFIKDTQVRTRIDLRGRRADLEAAIGLLRAKGFNVSVEGVLDPKPTVDEAPRG